MGAPNFGGGIYHIVNPIKTVITLEEIVAKLNEYIKNTSFNNVSIYSSSIENDEITAEMTITDEEGNEVSLFQRFVIETGHYQYKAISFGNWKLGNSDHMYLNEEKELLYDFYEYDFAQIRKYFAQICTEILPTIEYDKYSFQIISNGGLLLKKPY